MTALTYGTSSFDRDRGNFPKFPVINMIAEDVPTETGPALQSRPGLDDIGVSMGSGPVKTLLQMDGILSGQLFGISGSGLYSSGTLIGAIDGTGHASLAGYANYVFANAGKKIWGYDGTTLAALAFPDSTDVIDICVGLSRLIAIRKDTGTFFWSDPLTSTIEALSFATAENSPDRLKACLFLGDTLILLGSETVEFWPNVGDPDIPFQPLVGRTFSVGVRDTDSATLFNGSFAWVTNRNQICLGDQHQVISNPSIEEKLDNSDIARLWVFLLEGVEYLALTLDDETWIFNSRTTLWSQFESYGEDNWIPRCYAQGVFGSSLTGNLIGWTDDHSDFGGILERRLRAGLPTDSKSGIPIYRLSVRINTGQTPFLSGDYSEPVVSLRTSGDGGFLWSPWKERSLGKVGEYGKIVHWLSLGFAFQPGFIAEIKVTDPVPFRLSGMVVNE